MLKQVIHSDLTRFAGLVAIALVTLAAGCSDKPAAPTLPKPVVTGNVITFAADSPQLAVLTVVAAQAAVESRIELTGRLTWNEDRTVRIYPPLGGRVTRISAQAGDQVKAGQVLASMASPEFGQAQADVGKATADFALAEKSLARVKELLENGVAPRKDLAQAEADHARARSELNRAQARVQLYGGGAGIDQSLALKTPVAGVVVERNINPGQELRSDQGGTPALFVVTDPSRLWVQIDANEKDLPFLAKGTAFVLRSPSVPGETFEAKVDAVADFIDPQSRVIKARGAIDNSARKLKGEMLVTAEFTAKGLSAVMVPSRAVMFAEGKHYVFAELGKGKFERMPVTVGIERKGQLAVMSGLQPNQRIVTEGVLSLQQVMRAAGSKTED